jgi:predicted benzoate:H+ symporter BenE
MKQSMTYKKQIWLYLHGLPCPPVCLACCRRACMHRVAANLWLAGVPGPLFSATLNAHPQAAWRGLVAVVTTIKHSLQTHKHNKYTTTQRKCVRFLEFTLQGLGHVSMQAAWWGLVAVVAAIKHSLQTRKQIMHVKFDF